MIKSVDGVIKAAGGPLKSASLAGVKPSAVSNWRKRGSIPSDHFLTFCEALRPDEVDPTVFGFKTGAEIRA